MKSPLQQEISESDLNEIARLLHERTGLRFMGARRRFLNSRVNEVIEMLDCGNIGALLDLIKNAGRDDVFQRVVDQVITDETSFFRYPEHFDALRHFILPAIASNRDFSESGDRTIRILSAGCSRGHEPYSIAMSCLEEKETLSRCRVIIYALDLSKPLLEIARDGIYDASEVRHLPTELSSKYFTPAENFNGRGQKIEVIPELKEMIRFQQCNLKDELAGPIFDVVFCRNVTIYFDETDTRKVAENLYSKLLPGGYLFLGHAESYYGILSGLCTVQFGEALVNRKPVK
jgi:chemotaxis protein methyltransferase CheR